MSLDLDFTLAAPSGVCVELVGAAGVAAWDKLVMVRARDLFARCQSVADRLGARYVWEALSDGGQLSGDYSRLLKACDDWQARAERAGVERVGWIVDGCDEYQEILVKLEAWKNWGLEPV
jgi:non-ribosomal peptide synthetase component F